MINGEKAIRVCSWISVWRLTKLCLVTLSIAGILLTTACHNGVTKNQGENGGVPGHLSPEDMPEAMGETSEGVVDIRNLNSTMLYAEVFNMMMYPQNYAEKKIMVKGQYYGEYDSDAGQYFHFVFISDAQACCQQGLEFVWAGKHVAPDDYPPIEAEIEVVGIWRSYRDGENTFYRLEESEMKVI